MSGSGNGNGGSDIKSNKIGQGSLENLYINELMSGSRAEAKNFNKNNYNSTTAEMIL